MRSRSAGRRPRGALPELCAQGRIADRRRFPGRNIGRKFRRASPFIPPTPAELAPYFPDLEILEFVGRGGMGMVFRARQKHLDRLVALKILLPSVGKDPAFADRFGREARAMAMLSHSRDTRHGL